MHQAAEHIMGAAPTALAAAASALSPNEASEISGDDEDLRAGAPSCRDVGLKHAA
jgi:hypothetical protein